MTSLLGCSGEDFASILRGLGYRAEKRTVKVPVKPAKPVDAEAEVTSGDAASVVAVEPETPSEVVPVAEPLQAKLPPPGNRPWW